MLPHNSLCTRLTRNEETSSAFQPFGCANLQSLYGRLNWRERARELTALPTRRKKTLQSSFYITSPSNQNYTKARVSRATADRPGGLQPPSTRSRSHRSTAGLQPSKSPARTQRAARLAPDHKSEAQPGQELERDQDHPSGSWQPPKPKLRVSLLPQQRLCPPSHQAEHASSTTPM